MIKKARLSPDQLKRIHAVHGHSKGGLSLYSVIERKKVHVVNPVIIEHKHKHGSTFVASGLHNGNKVCGIVQRHNLN